MSALTERGRKALAQWGHPPEPNEEKLARRVLELPDTGNEFWYTASAITLSAAYLTLLQKANGLSHDN